MSRFMLRLIGGVGLMAVAAGIAAAHVTPPVVLASDREAVAGLLSGSRRYFVREVRLSPAERAAIQKQSGWTPNEDFYRFYLGRDDQGALVASTIFMTEYTIHGPVRVANTYHFAYADGTPYRQIGTTCYAWTHQGDEREEQTLATLKGAPFNKIRMCVFPKWYAYNRDEPPIYPFDGTPPNKWDTTRFNPAYFRHQEKRIAQLREQIHFHDDACGPSRLSAVGRND